MKVGCFVRHDAGEDERPRRSGRRPVGDCQVRALATVLDISYTAAWRRLYELQGERMGTAFELVQELASGDAFCAIEHLSFPAKRGRARMTPAAFCRAYPRGRYLLHLAGHVAAVVDGTLYDTWDCSQRCVYEAWRFSEPMPANTGTGDRS